MFMFKVLMHKSRHANLKITTRRERDFQLYGISVTLRFIN